MLSRLQILASFGIIALAAPCQSVAAKTIHVPDDRRTIQAAIDAAGDGDTVLVKPGTYRERLRMRDGLTLKSAGNDAKGQHGLKRAQHTIIDGSGKTGTGPGVAMAARSTLDGFTVTNVGVYDDATWKKHHATRGADQSHEHIGQPGTPGISIIGVGCTVRNNIVHHIGSTGIAIQGSENKRCAPHVYRNTCYRNMGGGIGSMRKSTAMIEENTCFQNFYAGIGHNDASPSVINNHCYENIRAGIGISQGACPLVSGNRCSRNRRAGIGTRTGTNTRPIIENNDCYENDMAGIGTEEEASPVIRNNRCYRNKLAGIGSRTAATPIIQGNECYQNGTAGIGQESDAITVLLGNRCHGNKASGIGFAACKVGRSTVMNNRITDNALVAVGIQAGWTVRLCGNELSREDGMPPLVMVSNGANATFTDNTIHGGGVAAIRVAGTARVQRNKIIGISLRKAGPPNFAVWALSGSQVFLADNHIQRWRHALHAIRADVSVINNRIRDFHKTAIVIQQPPRPTDVYGNTAVSPNPGDQVLSLDGEAGVRRDNRLTAPDDQKP